MTQVNVLSPHLDDAVLSSWHQIEQPSSRVITLFAGIPDTEKTYLWDRFCGLGNGREAVQERRLENEEALRDSHTSYLNLNHLDRLYRPSKRDISEIAETIEAVSESDATFIACAGIGTHLRRHPDHITARKVAQELQHRSREVSFYIDIPYALPHHNFSRWPEDIPKDKILKTFGSSVTVRSIELSPYQQARKRAAVRAYVSQYRMVNALSLRALNKPQAYGWEGIITPNL